MELQTARLRPRLWREEDLGAVARWNADPVVMRHMGRGPMTRQESAEALARYRRHWDEHGFGLWAAELLTTGELVGRIGLSYHRAWPDDPEVGWLIDPAHVGDGLATEGGPPVSSAAAKSAALSGSLAIVSRRTPPRVA